MDVHTPVLRYESVGVGGVTIDFAAIRTMGSIYMVNTSATALWFAFGGVAPVASFGNDRKQLAQNESVNLDNIEYTSVSARTAAGTADWQVIAIQRSGNSGAEL